MIRKHKRYSRPKRPFEKERILEEAEIKEKYGLKNKREIWKVDSKLKRIRERAKNLIPKSEEEKKKLIEQLKKLGLNVNSIEDILMLTREDLLERRLQTILVRKGLAPTMKAARQMIVHKKIIVGGKAVDSPSYIVPKKFENDITIKKKTKKEEKPEEAKEPEQEDNSQETKEETKEVSQNEETEEKVPSKEETKEENKEEVKDE